MNKILNEREIELVNHKENWASFTLNQTIMDLAQIYITELEEKDKQPELINWARLYFKMVLPYELLSFNRKQEIWAFQNNK